MSARERVIVRRLQYAALHVREARATHVLLVENAHADVWRARALCGAEPGRLGFVEAAGSVPTCARCRELSAEGPSEPSAP